MTTEHPTTPTPGAMRAAEAIWNKAPISGAISFHQTTTPEKLAALIDRETGAADLLAALEAFMAISSVPILNGNLIVGPECKSALDQARRAIANAKDGKAEAPNGR